MLLTGAMDFAFLDISSQLNIIWQIKSAVKHFYSKYSIFTRVKPWGGTVGPTT